MRIHWLWLALHPGLNDTEKARLMRCVADPEQLLTAPEGTVWPEDCLDLLERVRQDRSLAAAEQVLEECARRNIRIISFHDKAYPEPLRYISDPPVVLYCKGRLPDLNERAVIAVVGTRKASPYGLNTARVMGYQIARCGAAVVSGMAMGIDRAAMEGALEAGGTVIGVLGCGVEQIYPKSNRELFLAMEGKGAILSEYPPGTQPMKWNFPRRNRIISGLSCGVLVVEAPEKSGSMITARQAGEQGRDVFVVPGNVDLAGFSGSYRLLREGAIPANCGWDVVGEYAARYPDLREDRQLPPQKEQHQPAPEPATPSRKPEKASPKPEKASPKPEKPAPSRQKVIDKEPKPPYIDLKDKFPKLHPDEQLVVLALQKGERAVDDVIAETGLTTGAMLAAMTMLELKGIVRRLSGKRIRLN